MNTNQRITPETKIILEKERIRRIEAGAKASDCGLTKLMEEAVKAKYKPEQ